jgi:hypothetical protein
MAAAAASAENLSMLIFAQLTSQVDAIAAVRKLNRERKGGLEKNMSRVFKNFPSVSNA